MYQAIGWKANAAPVPAALSAFSPQRGFSIAKPACGLHNQKA